MSSKKIIKLANTLAAKYKLAQDSSYRASDKSMIINQWKSDIQSDSYLLNQKFDLHQFSFSIPEINDLSFISNGTPVSLKVKIDLLEMNVGPSRNPKSDRYVSDKLYNKAPGVEYLIPGVGICKVLLPINSFSDASSFLAENLISGDIPLPSEKTSFLSTSPYTLQTIELHDPILLNYNGSWNNYSLPEPTISNVKEKSFFQRLVGSSISDIVCKFTPDIYKRLESEIFTPKVSSLLIDILRIRITSYPLNLD